MTLMIKVDQSIINNTQTRGEYFPKNMKLFPDGHFQNYKLFPENGM